MKSNLIGGSLIILFLILLILKINNYIDISWLYVTLPIWILPAMGLVLSIVVYIVVFFATMFGVPRHIIDKRLDQVKTYIENRYTL